MLVLGTKVDLAESRKVDSGQAQVVDCSIERGYKVFLDLGSQREAETCGGLGPGSPLVVRAVHVPGQQTEPPAKQVGAGADHLHHQEAGQ